MIKVVPCQARDLPAVARIFSQSFPDSIQSFLPEGTDPVPALTDIFALLQTTVPGFFVAYKGDDTAGYIVVPAGMGRIWLGAFTRGAVFRWTWNWLRGKYNIPMARLPLIILNKLLFVGSEKKYSPPGSYGRVLSLAVSPRHRGQGLSKLLLARGMQHLAGAGMEYVKLEVRPDNIPALRAYTGFGFQVKGQTRDRQGQWLVLVKKL